jgi:ribosomal protein L11 methyltransferase
MMFYEIEFPLAALSSAEVEAALFEVGASSITFLDGGNEPVLEPKPGEIRLWSDTVVRALFDESHDAMQSLGRLADRLGPHITACASVQAVKNQDWERAWLAGWKPMRFGGRLWVCPTEADAPQEANAVVVRLDPGLAFGTGTHPTTALCLQFLDAMPLAGRSVIDYGCGSGILGIAALKLGASQVVAVDLDPQALLATRENAVRNAVSARLRTQAAPRGTQAAPRGTQAAPGALEPADLVLANILAEPLIELAPILTGACRIRGDLILSGLLRTQAYAVKTAYGSAFDMVHVVGQDDWCCIHARRAS